MLSDPGAFAINLIAMPQNARYDPPTDFTPIALVGQSPLVLVVAVEPPLHDRQGTERPPQGERQYRQLRLLGQRRHQPVRRRGLPQARRRPPRPCTCPIAVAHR